MISNGANDNLIGGTVAGARNVISANGGMGLHIEDGSDGIIVEGNLIGTDATGLAALGGNGTGVMASNGANDNVIGGTVAGAQNVIAANLGMGVHIEEGSDGNVVEGNLIGTDATGLAALQQRGHRNDDLERLQRQHDRRDRRRRSKRHLGQRRRLRCPHHRRLG